MKLPTFALDARLAGGTNTGDSTYWTGLLYGLARIQPKARFLLFSNRNKPDLIPESEQFPWIHLPGDNSRLWSLVRFPLAARKMGAEAIHCQYSLSPLVGSIGITTIHDVSFFVGPDWFSAKDRLLLRTTVPRAARRARAVITVSNRSKAEIARYIQDVDQKTFVTYNACPPWIEKIDPEQARREVSETLGISQPYALTVGTRWPRKNMELAVEAVEGVDPANSLRLVITGKSGWGENRLGKRSFAAGYVTNRQLSALYSAASTYLAPSRHEGFGIPVLEAFRCGCPVISSTGGALPEIVGDAGIVEPSWEAADWTRTLETLINDSSKLGDLRSRGFQREARFSWDEMARKTVEIYFGAARD